VHLIAGRNREGYGHALTRTWEDLSLPFVEIPVKSALTQARGRISFRFFRDIFEEQIEQFEEERPTYKGFHIYGVDGDQMSLPAASEILEHGYRGYPSPGKKETYFPRMYVTHAVDVMSGVSKAIRYSPHNDEHPFACRLARSYEKNSITLYDRLHLSAELIRAHHQAGNHFVVRCRRGATFSEVKTFFRSHQRNLVFEMDGIPVRLVKVRNPKTDHDAVFATSLPVGFLRNREIRQLYGYRWTCETTFRDFTSTLKAEQWHAKTLNGILQEFYAALWLMNFAKIEIFRRTKPQKDFMCVTYKKPNFKLIVDFLRDHFAQALIHVSRAFESRLDFLIQRTMEQRKHLQRSYPRQLREASTRYPLNSLVKRRA